MTHYPHEILLARAVRACYRARAAGAARVSLGPGRAAPTLLGPDSSLS